MKTSRGFSQPNRILSLLRFGSGVTLISAAAAMAFVAGTSSPFYGNQQASTKRALITAERSSASTFTATTAPPGDARCGRGRRTGSDRRSCPGGYDNMAYPATSIGGGAAASGAKAAKAIGKLPGGKKTNWQEVGPSGVPASALVASESTGALPGRSTPAARLRLPIAPTVTRNELQDVHRRSWRRRLGGRQRSCIAAELASRQASGIPSNAIGSIVFDPNDPNGNTLYVGTGEPNGSSDSEAGVGLYKSTDFGKTWTLVAGSTASTALCDRLGHCPVATGRSIGAIAIDPANANHIFIGTDVARHGSLQ